MSSYVVFARNWWQENPDWPDGLEPAAIPPRQGRKIAIVGSESEARERCADWMATHQFSKQDKRLSLKAEYTALESY